MKQIYHFTGTAGKQQSLKAGVALLLMGVMLTLLPASVSAQVLKTFTQRTSNYSPDMPIYHIKGDYTMIGNTNVTFRNETSNSATSNNSSAMEYVDVDGNTFTINSSTAKLTFSDEFGANPACSEVVYAGLYWTGRDNDNTMGRTILAEYSNPQTLNSGGEIGGYTLTITQSGNDRIFTFTNGSESVALTMSQERRNHYRDYYYDYYVEISNQQIYEDQGEYRDNNASDEHLATLPVHVTLPGTNYAITDLRWNSTLGSCHAIVKEVVTPAYIVSRNRIKIKHENASEYTEMEATLDNIYYSGQNGMTDYQDFYAAYVEVTDYVRQYGLGNYTVADLETHVGDGDNTGWIGGWCMVVVYENSKMKWRDITLFDGFARVDNEANARTVNIPISGFKTVQVGDINMKLGMMAAEGDAGIPNDGCKIEIQNTGEFYSLTHNGYTSDGGFFNSSIQTGGNYRYPNYVNNTGIDIITLNINSDQNDPDAILYNEQTSTTFQFTSTQDLYFPICFVMGVDAYIPEAEALSGVMNIDEEDVAIDSETGNYLIEPGKEITFAVEVKNFGTEDIVDAKLEIPLPSTIVYYRTKVEYVHPGINIEGYFDAERYANGVAGWNIDYIPSGDPNQVYARVLLTVKVTDDCYVLASTDEDCELAIEVNGTLEGISYVNRVYFKKESFISGFADKTGCQGNAIRNDIKVVVNKEDYVNNHCQDRNYTVRLVNVCRNDFNAANPIPFMKIYALYPQGSRFFNATTGEEYTAATGFPISLAATNSASATLIHVQPTSIYSAACTSDLRFILDSDGNSFTTPTLTNSATYCLDAQANPLSSHITSTIPDDVYFRFYKVDNNSAVAYVDIVPPTDVEGTYTYYVRQFRENAIGCEDENFYGPITIEVVSPITFTSSEASPSCIGNEVRITGRPARGTWSWPNSLTGITVLDSVLIIDGNSAGTYTVTYTHNNPGSAGYSCTNTARSYTHQIAATTNPGTLEADQTICQGAQIQPLKIVGHNGHVERWEWTTNQSNDWDPIPNNTSSISTADLGELAVGTYYVRALVKDGNCRAEWTNTVTIEVTDDLAPTPPAVTSPQYACIGTDYPIAPSGDNYQWYEQAIGGWPIGGNTPVHSVTVTVTDEWITRYVSVVDAVTHCVSNRAEVQVRPNLEPGAIATTGQRECDLSKTPTTIGSNQDAVAYGEGTVEYQWYVQVNGGEAEAIAEATSATFTPSAYMGTEGEYIFTRKVRNSTCANWQQSRGSWRLVVGKPNASIEAVPGHAIICEGAGVELRLSVPSSTAYSYQWYKDRDSIPYATGHEYIATEIGTYTARVTHKASGCSATTPEAGAINVKSDNAPPTASDETTDLDGCSIDEARAVTAYNNVIDANASEFGFNIYDSITPVDSLKLTYEDEIVNSPTGACYQLVRTYTVTDQCGFSTTFTHTINVVDDVAPTISADNLNTTLTSTSCNFTLPDFTSEVREISSDNCTAQNNLEITQNPAGTTYTPGTTPQTVTVTVTVKDACGNSSTKNIVVTIPAALTASATPTHVSCNGASDGEINYTIAGGTAGYTVVLSGGSANQTVNQTAAGTYTFTGLAAGTYTVTVTDANGCTATASATVSEPSALTVTLNPENETCAGDDGKINYTIAGGTAGYTVVLSGGSANQTVNQTAAGTYTFTGLKAGTYTVTVTDDHDCVATATATVTLSNNFTVTPSNTAVCSGETFTVNPTASHAAQYSWSAPSATGITGAEAGMNASNISGTLTNTTTSATSITYTVTATTTNGLCTASPFEVEVTVYAPVTGGSIQKDFISCNVADTIVRLTSVTAGNGGYGGTHGWQKSTDNGTTWTTIPNSNGADYTPNYHDNLGTVLYRRMYSANCDEKPSDIVSVTYYGNILAGDVICNSGCAANYCSGSSVSVTLSTSNITVQSGASYSIQWQQSIDNGATWTDISGATSDTYTYTNPNFTSPIQFRYTITVTGCAAVSSNSVHSIGVWALPVVSIAEVATLCPSAASTDIKGTIETTTTPNYTYYWNPGSGLTLPNLPESATSETSNTITGTFPTADCNATYSASLYVVDGNGCESKIATETFTVVDTEAPVIRSGYATTVEATVSNCAYTYPDLRGSIREYSTDNCTEALKITQSPEQGASITQTAEAQTLPVTVTVKDACNKETTTTIYVTVPAQLKLAETHTDETCNESNNGTIDLTVTGGKGNYTYSWQKDGSSYSPATQYLSGLEAATYTVTVADAHGCTATISATITEPDPLQITSLSSASNCYNQADGYINYTFSGGTPDYTVSIGTATNDHATAENGSFTDLADGSYTVTVTDANGCTTTATTTIQQFSDTLTITAQSNTWEYNGQPHTQPYYNVTFGSEQYSIAFDSSATLANGDVVTATVSGSITNAGTEANTVTGVTVKRRGTDVMCYYNIVEVDGELTVTSNDDALTLTCPSGASITKMYDGAELAPVATVSSTISGDTSDDFTIEYSTDGGATWSTTVPSITHVGTQDVKVRATNPNYVTETCEYTLAVTKRSVTVAIAGHTSTTEYNGAAHTVTGYDITSISNALYTSSDFTFSGSASASRTDTGTTNMGLAEDQFTNNNANFEVTFNVTDGYQTITPKPLTIMADSETKVYDGMALTKNSYTNTDLASGDAIESVIVTGSQTVAGTSNNVPSAAVIKDGTEDVTSNYNITYTNGTLTVKPRPITLTSASASKIYDGTPLTNSTVTVGGDGFVAGEGATYDVTGTITNVGSCSNAFTYTLNSNTDANNYTITKIEGTLTILIDSVLPCIGCDSIAGVSCETIGNQTRTNDENQNYYTHSGTSWNVTATDNSGAVPTLTWTLTGATTASGSTTLDGQKFYIGVTTVTWTAEDPAGNTADCSFIVTVNDITNPVLTCPTITAEYECLASVPAAYADYAAFVAAGGTATDNHQIDTSSFAVTETEVTGCPTTITRTYSIKDMAENEGTCTQVITVEDKTAPTIGTDDLDRTLTSTNCVFTIPDLTAEVRAISSDNCTDTASLVVTQSSAGMQVYPMATARDTIVSVTVTDACDKTSTKSVTITIPAKVTISASATPAVICNGETSQLNSTVANIVGPAVYEWTPTTGLSSTTIANPTATLTASGASATTTYTVQVTDGNGCAATATTSVTVYPKVVMDTVADQAICHGSEMAAVNFTTPITDGSVVYNWSRDNDSISGLAMSGTGNIPATVLTNTTNTAQVDTITVTPVYTNNGNECTDESITFTITVYPKVVMNTVADWTLCVGETSPEYVYTSTITDGTVTYGWRNNTPAIGLAAMGEGNLPSFVAANATSADLIAEVKVAPTYANNGISCQGDSINFHITVRPSIKTPGNVTFTCPADTTVVLSYSECEQLVNIGEPEFENHMSGMNVNITNDAPEGNIFPEGTTIVTWTATDDCGAFLTCTQNVVVQFPSCGDSIADFDGYRYSSVRIGCQCWTGENARSEHYSDGTPVDNFRYYNDSDSLENIYGKLYSWYAAVRVPEGDDTAVPADSIDPLGNSYVQGICPEGWALPTVDEYMLMIANSGNATHAKDGSNLHWLPGYEGQSPLSGFDAFGAGMYNEALARYEGLLGKTYFWTTLNVPGSETATTVEINYYCAEGLQTELSKGDGVSIRCIRKR